MSTPKEILVSALFSGGRSRSTAMQYGIEIELEPLRNAIFVVPGADQVGMWRTIEDGSLRSGIELVSAPLLPSVVETQLQLAYAFAKERNYGATSRCGMHVHANMAGRTVEGLAQVLACYILAEPVLFSYAGTEREQNIYCIPWYHDRSQHRAAKRLVSALAQHTHGERVTSVSDGMTPRRVTAGAALVWRELCKYSALNLIPLCKQHTIEFRHLQAPESHEDALRWWKAIHLICTSAPRFVREQDKAGAILAELGDILGTRHANAGAELVVEECLSAVADSVLAAASCTYKTQDWGLPLDLLPEVSRRYDNVRNLGNHPVVEPDTFDGAEVYSDMLDSGVRPGGRRRGGEEEHETNQG